LVSNETKAFYGIQIATERYVKSHPRGVALLTPTIPPCTTQTHDPDVDTIWWIGYLAISSENQLVSSEGKPRPFMALESPLQSMSRVVHVGRAAVLTPTIYIYIYIYRERERERNTHTHTRALTSLLQMMAKLLGDVFIDNVLVFRGENAKNAKIFRGNYTLPP
jgi:hypothetical protein